MRKIILVLTFFLLIGSFVVSCFETPDDTPEYVLNNTTPQTNPVTQKQTYWKATFERKFTATTDRVTSRPTSTAQQQMFLSGLSRSAIYKNKFLFDTALLFLCRTIKIIDK
jgi:hypothetical protein